MANINRIFRNVDEALPRLLEELNVASEITSRAGVVKELTHVGITLTHPWEREITTPDRKPILAAQIAETMWVLAGRSDIEWLEHYLPRARDFSDDGETWRAGYGERLRGWKGRSEFDGVADQVMTDRPVDQLTYIIDLLKRDPSSRQAVMSIWDPNTDTHPGKDIPCNNWLSFLSRDGALDLSVAIRSNDIIWGWSGINAFEWSALQEIAAGILGLNVGRLHFIQTSLHLYDKHWAKAEKIRNSSVNGLRGSARNFDASTFDRTVKGFDVLLTQWFKIEYDIRTGSPLVDGYVEAFPEPMLRSWLRVLQWWWSKGDRSYLDRVGARLTQAALAGVQPKRDEAGSRVEPPHFDFGVKPDPQPDFLSFVTDLHNEKHAAYGDSWKRRGEMLGIMANIARKVDRLGGAETADETSADTAIDLFVYLVKYHGWLFEEDNHELLGITNDPENANNFMAEIQARVREDDGQPIVSRGREEQYLKEQFDHLEQLVVEKRSRGALVADMASAAYALARRLWEQEQLEKTNRERLGDYPVKVDVETCSECGKPKGVPDDSFVDQYRGSDVD